MASAFCIFYAILLSSLFIGSRSQTVVTSCDGTTTSLCSSCTTQFLCSTNSTGTCLSGQVCQQISSTISLCTDPANFPSCACPATTGLSNQCDFYDDTISIACFDGVIEATQNCSETSQICIEDTGLCGTTPEVTSGPTTVVVTAVTDTTCASSNTVPTKRNCTAFYLCQGGDLPADHVCSDGQVFSDIAHNCIEYRAFSCALDAPGMQGLFPNPANCSLYYVCLTDGTQGVSQCPSGEYFDETLGGCAENTGECTDDICTPCKTLGEVFPVNTTACVSEYQECVTDTDSTTSSLDDGFTFTTKSCPDTFVFDPNTNSCTRTCTISRKKRIAHHKTLSRQ